MLFRLGVALIVLSFVPWIFVAGTFLVGVSLTTGAGFVGGSLVGAEVMFWGGLALAGKDTWQAVKAAGWRGAPGELARLFVEGRPIQ